jgi:hypothetical protein
MQDRKKDITSYNHKGRPHGHWEIYWSDNTLAFKTLFLNDKYIGFKLSQSLNNEIINKEYYAR